MARRVVVQLVDDLDGGDIEDGAGGTVRFALDQVDYEIDLGAHHGEQLRAALQPYIERARKVRDHEASPTFPLTLAVCG